MSRVEPGIVRHRLDLAELVAVAELAGAIPLPVRPEGGAQSPDRLSERLTGTPASAAPQRIAAAVRRAADPGPGGARVSLAARGLLEGDLPDAFLAGALTALAGAPLAAVLDVSVTRRAGVLRLRSWFGAGSGPVAQLWTADGLAYELACFDPALWTARLARAIRVEPRSRERPARRLPAYVSLPSELLAGCAKAHGEHRPDLLAPMASSHAGLVRAGEPGQVRRSDPAAVLALLHTLGAGCRGRLRLLMTRRDRAAGAAVACWLLFDDGWHELRPGRGGTSVLRRRGPRDLGLFTQPAVTAAREEGRRG